MNFHGRYLIRGFVDGVLSTLGVVIGASTVIGASAEAGQVIIAAGVGGGMANGLSNILGAFMAEKVMVGERLKEMEKAMLKEEALRGTKLDEKFSTRTVSGSVSDGLATIAGSLIPVFPFVLIPLLMVSEMTALLGSVVVSLVLFGFLGGYVGKVTKENIILSALKMMSFAAITAVIATLIRTII